MAVADKVREQTTSGGSSTLKTAAAAAATGAATYAVRRALSGDGRSRKQSLPQRIEQKVEEAPGMLNSVLSSGWDAAADALYPLAEEAADAAGRYLAEHGPELLRERIVPRFIEAFENAR
jgi:hypothetical protein